MGLDYWYFMPKILQTFSNHINDLELILFKFRESRLKHKIAMNESEDEERKKELMDSVNVMRFNIQTILLVFYDLLYQVSFS